MICKKRWVESEELIGALMRCGPYSNAMKTSISFVKLTAMSLRCIGVASDRSRQYPFSSLDNHIRLNVENYHSVTTNKLKKILVSVWLAPLSLRDLCDHFRL